MPLEDVVKKEIMNWLDASLVYPNLKIKSVRLILYVSKKVGITMVPDKKNEHVVISPVMG